MVSVEAFGRTVTEYELMRNNYRLRELSARHGLFFFGERGSGKDALMCHQTHLRAEPHYANIDYGDLTLKSPCGDVTRLTELHVGGNTYATFLSGDIIPFEPNFTPRADMYISDAGAFLPCHEDKNELEKKYPGMILHFALRRHMYDSNIHINSQALDRVWKKLREHYEHHIHCLGAEPRRNGLFLRAVYYSKRSSAVQGLLPPAGLSDAESARFAAAHGEVSELIFYAPKTHLTYDARYFGSALFGKPEEPPAPKAIRPFDYWR